VKKRVESEFEQFETNLREPASDLWIRHLASNGAMLGDFLHYLEVMTLRAQAHAVNLHGPELGNDLLRIQGGVRVLASIKLFVQSFIKAQSDSGRVRHSGRESENAGRPDARENSRTVSG